MYLFLERYDGCLGDTKTNCRRERSLITKEIHRRIWSRRFIEIIISLFATKAFSTCIRSFQRSFGSFCLPVDFSFFSIVKKQKLSFLFDSISSSFYWQIIKISKLNFLLIIENFFFSFSLYIYSHTIYQMIRKHLLPLSLLLSIIVFDFFVFLFSPLLLLILRLFIIIE